MQLFRYLYLLALPVTVAGRDLARMKESVVAESTTTQRVRGAKRRLPQHRRLQQDDTLLGHPPNDAHTNEPLRPKLHEKLSFTEAAAAAASAVVQEEERPGFDIVITGFPKCGATTLLEALQAHEETDMASKEQCAIASRKPEKKIHQLLDESLDVLSTSDKVKRGFQCPNAIYNYKSISRMEKHSPNAKLVIGMRHPVHMLQSYYNHRVAEIKERGLDQPFPL